jgi:hypothetical protein
VAANYGAGSLETLLHDDRLTPRPEQCQSSARTQGPDRHREARLTFHIFISEPTNRKHTRRPPVRHILGEAIRFKRRTAKTKLSRGFNKRWLGPQGCDDTRIDADIIEIGGMASGNVSEKTHGAAPTKSGAACGRGRPAEQGTGGLAEMVL